MKISQQEKIEKILKILREEIDLLPGGKLVQNAEKEANKGGLELLRSYLERKLKENAETDKRLEREGKRSLRMAWEKKIKYIVKDC